MIRLTIKGTRKAVMREAARRGIALKSCRVGAGGGGRAQVCLAPCSAQDKAHDWKMEHTGYGKTGRGFAPGVLITMNDRCETGQRSYIGPSAQVRRRRGR